MHYCASVTQSCTPPNNIAAHYKSPPSISSCLYGVLQFLSSNRSFDELLKLNKVLVKACKEVPGDPKNLTAVWDAVVGMADKVMEACTKSDIQLLKELIAKVGPNDLKMKEMTLHMDDKADTCEGAISHKAISYGYG